jgi:Peptidase family S41
MTAADANTLPSGENARPCTFRVRVGDVLVTVDGKSIAARKKKLTKYISLSTPHALDLALCFSVLLGPGDSPATLKLRGPDGLSRDVSLPRPSGQDDVTAWRGIHQYPELIQKTPVFSVLPEGYGYLDGVRLKLEQVSPAFDAIKATPALIIDLRGHAYPNIVSWFGDKPTAGSAGHLPYWTAPQVPGWTWQGNSGGNWMTYQQPTYNYWSAKYAGRVVVLINSDARSASEPCCLHLEQAAKGRITFIGTPTVGTNGNITFTSMPGGIAVRFSGVDIRHADGRQLQRVGIQPDIRVEPTIAGIAAGKDEVVEAAIKFLNESKAK